MVDIIVALSLSALFVVLITESSMNAREVFRHAHERSELLDIYETRSNEISSLLPYGIYSKNGLSAKARWYGNERIQTDVEVESTTSSQTVMFTMVRTYPFARISEAAGTPMCSVDFLEGSKNIMITPISLPISSSILLTHLEVRNGIAYISADSPKASDADIFVVDIREPLHSSLLSQINTGPGITSFVLAGNHIYAAAASTAAQLHSIRLDSLQSLILEKKYQIPLPYATATPPLGSSIFFNKNTIYLGTEKWDGDEFFIIDASSPSQPITKSSLNIDTKINDIAIRGDRAYIAASGEQQMVVADIQDVLSPHIIASFDPSGWSRQEVKVISVFEDSLNLGRTSGGFNIAQDHELFAWASTSLNWRPDVSSHQSVDIPAGVYGIVTNRNRIYLATRQIGKELQIFDMPLSTSTLVSYALPVAPQGMTCDGDIIYVLGKGASVIYKITSK